MNAYGFGAAEDAETPDEDDAWLLDPPSHAMLRVVDAAAVLGADESGRRAGAALATPTAPAASRLPRKAIHAALADLFAPSWKPPAPLSKGTNAPLTGFTALQVRMQSTMTAANMQSPRPAQPAR